MDKEKLSYYIIEDLSKWTIGQFSNLLRFNTLKEAIKEFKRLRKKEYYYDDKKAKLVLGASIGQNSEIDILHVRNNQNYLVTDFMCINNFYMNKEFIHSLDEISKEIGFDKVRVYKKTDYEDVDFYEWIKENYDFKEYSFKKDISIKNKDIASKSNNGKIR